VFATADEPRLTAAAWWNRNRGRNAAIMIQVVAMLPAAAVVTSSIPGHVSAAMLCHCWP